MSESKPAENLLASHHLPKAGRSCAWLLLFALVFLLAALLFLFLGDVYTAIKHPEMSFADITSKKSDGLSLNAMAGIYIFQFLALMPLIIVASHFVTQPWRQTLAVSPVNAKTVGLWLGVWAVYQVVAMTLHQFVDVPVDEFVRKMAGSKHLLMTFVAIVLAPVLEELVFRGYLFKAWRATKLGFSGTLLLTSVLFMLLHAGQYHPVLLLQLFVLALILGVARERTGSVTVPIAIHTANNAFACILLVFFEVQS